MTTVAELVAKLLTMPQDALVVTQMYSESVNLNLDDVSQEAMIERNGIYMHFDEETWSHKKDGKPKILAVCHFPGN